MMPRSLRSPGRSPAIHMRGLVKRFGATQALAGLDLVQPAGTTLAVLGPNGAGKTTAVRVVTTLLRPDAGEVRVFGRDVVTAPSQVRGSIGAVGQQTAVDLLLTGRETVVLAGRLSRLPRRAAAERAAELVERLGLAPVADRRVKTYSGGMRRRLDLAAALVADPPLLVLDEPTNGLDPAGRLGLWATVRELVGSGTSVLLTTQYLEEADRLADRVVFLRNGRLVAEGTPHQLKARHAPVAVEVHIDDPALRQVAAQALRGLGQVTAPSGSGAPLQVRATGTAEALTFRAVRALDDAGIPPVEVAVRPPTLDEVFLAVTGSPR